MDGSNPSRHSDAGTAMLGLTNRLALLEGEVRSQRTMILHILTCLVSGEPIHPEEDPIRSILDLPEGIGAQAAREALVRSRARVIGHVTCPKCGADVRDMEGIRNERCQWCGAEVVTER